MLWFFMKHFLERRRCSAKIGAHLIKQAVKHAVLLLQSIAGCSHMLRTLVKRAMFCDQPAQPARDMVCRNAAGREAIPESASDATPQCEAGADCKHSDCAKLHPRRKSPCHSSSNCVNVDCKHLHPACWDPFANAQSLVIIIPKKGSADSEALALRLSEDFSVKRGLLMNPATKKVAVMVEMYTPEAAQDLARQIHGKELAEQRVAAFPAATPEPWLALQDAAWCHCCSLQLLQVLPWTFGQVLKASLVANRPLD